ncbi:peptidase M23 [Neptunitalea chrysea]|uniref:Peptidase M23 n=1 Tax=Neptunitalea chrysea TaxID=1647581 RepID=A0A9W6B716_9FLAO|nr:M23 family metallopeptidase [Neptunitalea chrysea]GLB54061.1 peptidase M23 [Neptunitalea chrysea]
MKYFFLVFSILLLSNSRISAQKEYPKSDFISPLKIPLILAGNFGELRSNHYHAGIDIKTQQRQGLKVFSVADGYVSRIKISHYGYGKALYITHPNGYTTVYGHLKKFSKEIQKYVVQKQYEDESYEIELFPTLTELPVKQGDIVAYSGNTGSSGGPHLHFEFRDTETENIINPILFGMDVKDDSAPVFENIIAYTFNENGQINGKQGISQLNFSKQKDGSYLVNRIKASGEIAFGIKGFDRQKGSFNHNGIYATEILVNGTKYLDLKFDTFSFAESNQINVYIDYARYINTHQRFQKTYIDKGNHLSIYNTKTNDGKITIEPGKDYSITIILKDIAGNATKIYIPVHGEALPIKKTYPDTKTAYYIVADRDNYYEIDNASIFFPANTFYKNEYLDLKKKDKSLYVHNKEVPLHGTYGLTFDISNIKDSLNIDKYFIASYTAKGSPIYETTRLKGKTLSTRTKNLGRFEILKDNTPPSVRAVNFTNNQWISKYNYLVFKISDDLSGLHSYKATIDGKWILTEYEYKKNTLTFNCEDLTFTGTKHKLELVVTDNVGNSTTFTRTFFRKY